MRVLVTGATGLLGGSVARELAGVGSNDVVGAGHLRPGGVPLEITDAAAVRRFVVEGRFGQIVHCAALRDPGECKADPERAYGVNAVGVEHLARAAEEAGARLLYISTDYVFDGESPPYAEEDAPDPINLYGRTKLAGERAARAAPRYLIARVPALYSADLSAPRSFGTIVVERLRAGGMELDGETVRYYTAVEDVAAALRFLLEEEVEGMIHLSAEQRTSQLDFARRVARASELDPGLLRAGPRGVERPPDAHLATDRYRSLGGPPLRSIDEALGLSS